MGAIQKGKGSKDKFNANNSSSTEKQRMHDARSKRENNRDQNSGQTRAYQLDHEGYVELEKKAGEALAEQVARGEIYRNNLSQSSQSSSTKKIH